MAAARYSITVKYELHHSRGELVPDIEDVKAELGEQFDKGDELMISVSQGRRFEGARVVVDKVEVQDEDAK